MNDPNDMRAKLYASVLADFSKCLIHMCTGPTRYPFTEPQIIALHQAHELMNDVSKQLYPPELGAVHTVATMDGTVVARFTDDDPNGTVN